MWCEKRVIIQIINRNMEVNEYAIDCLGDCKNIEKSDTL